MFRYYNDDCPVCRHRFTENDDIVVCPVCGTPHHRDCYVSNGGCANDSLHDGGFSFVSASDGKGENEEKKSANVRVCKNCGTRLENGSSVCSHCGTYNDDIKTGTSSGSSSFTPPFAGFTTDINDSELINNVPVGDLKRFIGGNWFYYIPVFYNYAKNKIKVRVNMSAFIGTWAWLLSRKMYFTGIICALITAISFGFTYFFSALCATALNISDEYITFSAITNSGKPLLVTGYLIYSIVSNIPLVMMILLGLFGNRMYMKKCIKNVKAINKKSKSAEEFNERLQRKGGLSIVLLSICFTLVVSFYILFARGYFDYFIKWLVDICLPYIN